MRLNSKWALGILVVAGMAGLYLTRGHVRCYLFYPECNPVWSIPKEKPWKIPDDPVEKAAYDYSHALPLPPGMPQTVPFDFKAARLKEGYGGKRVAQQYFEHLCKTEDVEVIHKVAKDVEGFQLLRPRPNMEESPLNTDRYGAEEPTGYGWLSDQAQIEPVITGGLESYVQPLSGVYSYVEYQHPDVADTYARVDRAPFGDTNRYPAGVEANWRPANGAAIEVPYLKRLQSVPRLSSQYLYTWRGIRRLRDREFGIGGGEYLIVDKGTQKVLGAKRTFNSTYVPRQPSFTNWYAARECRSLETATPIPYFVKRVLNPVMSINDQHVPPRFLEQYQSSLKKEVESRYEQ